jgi:hypothetical protein
MPARFGFAATQAQSRNETVGKESGRLVTYILSK